MGAKRKGRPPGPNPVASRESALAYLRQRRGEQELATLIAMVRYPRFEEVHRRLLHRALTPPRDAVREVVTWLAYTSSAFLYRSTLLGESTARYDVVRALVQALEGTVEQVDVWRNAEGSPSLDVDSVALVVIRECARMKLRQPTGPEMAALEVSAGISEGNAIRSNEEGRKSSEQRWAQALKRARIMLTHA